MVTMLLSHALRVLTTVFLQVYLHCCHLLLCFLLSGVGYKHALLRVKSGLTRELPPRSQFVSVGRTSDVLDIWGLS